MNSIKEQSILGVKVHAVDMQAVMAQIEGFILSGKPHIVVTEDASGVVLAQSDHELRSIINSADLVTPDSTGILWAHSKFGQPLPERVSGVDIVDRLCARSATAGYRVFLLGSEPGVADDAATELQRRYPGLEIAGTHHGYFGASEDDAVAQIVKAAHPDVLFVAFGIPRQEKWIYSRMNELQVPVSMGVGGTFDVLSGRVKRAPKWMQRRGLEWIYRLASNPKKYRKCMTLPIFVLMVLRSLRQRVS